MFEVKKSILVDNKDALRPLLAKEMKKCFNIVFG